MKRFWSLLTSTALLAVVSQPGHGAEQRPIQLPELIDLLRTNLADADAAALNEATVRGLVQQLSPRVMIDGVKAGNGSTNAPLVSDATVYERNFAYLRVGRFGAGLDGQFNEALDRLSESNRLKGLVLDLRYAGGGDYGAAVALADRFFAAEQPLLDWGTGMKKSTAKDSPITMPVAILVNRETRSAAEAFAGMLRHGKVAIVLGTNTAGEACLFRDFTLSTGQRVQVATATVRLGDNHAMSAAGLKPDITIEVTPEAEKVYFANAFAPKPGTDPLELSTNNNPSLAGGTNRPPRRRINEAELVRAQREGREPGDETNRTARPEPVRPLVSDPALARALDLLKGLSLVQQFRGR